MYRRHRYTTKRRKPRRRAARTEASKAKSLQGAWRKATDRTGTLPMEDARKIVADPPVCPYCEKQIPYKAVSVDHKQPKSRGGESSASNLVWCCYACNQQKGALTAEEFSALLKFLSDWPEMKKLVLMRLHASGGFYRGRKWARGR